MTALYIILGIIAFLIILLSVKFVITVHYEDDITVSLGWLFLKFNLLPMKEKEKKPKKEKKEKKPEENSEVIPEPKEKKDNMFVRFYRNRGVSGVVQLLKDAAKALGGGFKRMGRAFLFEELFVSMTVGAGDSAQTAIKYGKVCSALYPSLGFICSNMKVKDYKVNVLADYCGEKTTVEFVTKTAFIPRALINAGIALVFSLLKQLLKVVISNNKSSNNNTNRKAD